LRQGSGSSIRACLKIDEKYFFAQVKAGESFEVLNRGKVAAHIVPPTPRQVLRWPDYLATAHKNTGRKGSDIIREPTEMHELLIAQQEPLPVYFERKLHVAAARLCDASVFVTADKRQAALAEVEGRAVKLL
jgi:antitoxin (DNA-binding transcriptional repressor) of toxin-antitoxin stability system